MARNRSGLPDDKIEECGCNLLWGEVQIQGVMPKTGFAITYCPLHSAAPALLEALENTLDGLRNVARRHIKGDCFNPEYKYNPCRCSLCRGKRAIARAKEVPANAQ